MIIKFKIEKRGFLVVFFAFLLLVGTFAVYAYGTNNPRVFGHSADEVRVKWENVLNRPTGSSVDCAPDQIRVGFKNSAGVKVSECRKIPICTTATGNLRWNGYEILCVPIGS